MFAKFTSALNYLTEGVALEEEPTLSNFMYHWKSVTSFFVSNKELPCRVEESGLAQHFDKMLTILIREEELGLSEDSCYQAGKMPCLDFLLDHRVLESIHKLGRADAPRGMQSLTLRFFSQLLSKTTVPILPHTNAHRPIKALVSTCNVPGSYNERDEVSLLSSVAGKLRMQPELVDLFLEENGSGGFRFVLMEKLFAFVPSEDNWVSLKACEGILLLLSVKHSPRAAPVIEEESLPKIASWLEALYTRLCMLENFPIPYQHVLATTAQWGVGTTASEDQKFHGRLELVRVSSWLDYIDNVCNACEESTSIKLSSIIVERFFIVHFHANIMKENESHVAFHTAFLIMCLKHVNNSLLLDEFCKYLFGLAPYESTGHALTIFQILISRCNHISDEVSSLSMEAFCHLLRKKSAIIYEELVVKYTRGRHFISGLASDCSADSGLAVIEPTVSANSFVSDSESEDENKSLDRHIACSADPATGYIRLLKRLGISCDIESSEMFDYLQSSKTELNFYVNLFLDLDLMPKIDLDGTGPAEQSVPDFTAGPLMQMVLTRLKCMFCQSEKINNSLVRLIVKLYLLPHPDTSEYITDPRVAAIPTIFSALSKLSKEAERKSRNIIDFSSGIAKFRSMSEEELDAQLDNIANEYFYRHCLCLEHLLKMAAAITHVKHVSISVQ